MRIKTVHIVFAQFFLEFLNAHHCYVCSNINSMQILSHIQDKQWKTWLRNVGNDPQTDECLDQFTPEYSLRSGVKTEHCDNGTCLKMTVNEPSGETHVWRSCLQNSAKLIRSDCTEITTRQGSVTICTCFGHLCNSAKKIFFGAITIITLIIYFQQ